MIYVFSAPEDEKQVYINYAIDGLKDYIEKRKFQNSEEIVWLFSNYLENQPIEWFSDSKTLYEQWKEIPNDSGINACEVLSIPCSEAAVERLYSFLTSITSSSMYNSSFESIEARLMIHLNSIW